MCMTGSEMDQLLQYLILSFIVTIFLLWEMKISVEQKWVGFTVCAHNTTSLLGMVSWVLANAYSFYSLTIFLSFHLQSTHPHCPRLWQLLIYFPSSSFSFLGHQKTCSLWYLAFHLAKCLYISSMLLHESVDVFCIAFFVWIFWSLFIHLLLKAMQVLSSFW